MSRPVLASLLCLFLIAPAAGHEVCSARQYMPDPAGDHETAFLDAVLDARPADLLGVAIERTHDGLLVETTLAADPRAVPGQAFSYWVSFEDGGLSAGGNPPTWTFQGSTTYDVIQTMYWDGPAGYPVTWDGNTFSFVIPWSSFEYQYGDAWPVPFGSPQASSSGGGPSIPNWGLNNPSQDWVSYSWDMVPLPEC